MSTPATPTDLFLEGGWTPATDDRRFDVTNPATAEVLATVADAGPTDGLRALDAAAATAADWAAAPPRQRSEILHRAWELLRQRRETFAALMTAEMGKPLAEARGEVDYGGEFLRWFAEEAVRVNGRYGIDPSGTGTMIVSHRPVGPCLLITPWNFPLAMATRKLAPALAAGCTVVLKPSELTPLTSLLLADLLREAGVPGGVLNVTTTTDAARLTAPLLTDPRLRKLSFTGSTPVGRALLATAAGTVLRTSMELGGNAPFLVFADADVDAAVDGAMQAKFRNIGQACTAANRFLLAEEIAEEFLERLAARVARLQVGPGNDDSVDIGPLVDHRAVTKVSELVDDARDRGATLMLGGTKPQGPGSYYTPTILTAVPDHARLWQEEIFGPVLAAATFAHEDEAIRRANATEYGLVAYAWTRDLARAHRLLERLETGMLGINRGVVSQASAPFGGVKQSGLGREGGSEGIAEYLETIYALIPR